MYVLPTDRALKDEFIHTKYSKMPKINIQGFRNKAISHLFSAKYLGYKKL